MTEPKPALPRSKSCKWLYLAIFLVVAFWHHCTWCDVLYPHAPHMAVKVCLSEDDSSFCLFDWDLWRRSLLPITVRTARLFPELIPSGDVVQPLSVGLNPQLYPSNAPCLIVPATLATTNQTRER